MTETLLLLLKLTVATLIFAIGVDSRLSDLTYLWRRPGLLLRSLVAMYLLVPLVAVILAKSLDFPAGGKAALLVIAISAGAPLLPRKLMHLGEGDYVFSLVVISSLLAIVTVPAWAAVLGPLFHREAAIAPRQVAAVIGQSFLLPLVAGMAMRWLWPGSAERLSEALIKIAGLVLMICALGLLVLHWEVFATAPWPFLLSLALLALAALVIGHGLGGPMPDDRTALAVACATRHVGVAILVAAAVTGPRTAVLVATYVIAAALVSIPYLKWRRAAGSSMHRDA